MGTLLDCLFCDDGKFKHIETHWSGSHYNVIEYQCNKCGATYQNTDIEYDDSPEAKALRQEDFERTVKFLKWHSSQQKGQAE